MSRDEISIDLPILRETPILRAFSHTVRADILTPLDAVMRLATSSGVRSVSRMPSDWALSFAGEWVMRPVPGARA